MTTSLTLKQTKKLKNSLLSHTARLLLLFMPYSRHFGSFTGDSPLVSLSYTNANLELGV